jgi:hypothetical protein
MASSSSSGSPPASSIVPPSPSTVLPTSTPILHSLHNNFQHKLKQDNYRTWRAQIIPQLKGVSIFGHVDGSTPAPSQTVIVDNATVSNPEYIQWHLQDQLILGALLSSIDEHLITYVVHCVTSREVWETFERMFLSQARARTMQIHYQLVTLKKGNSSVADYFHKFTTLVDTLAAVDQPLNPFEASSFLLGELGSDFDSFVTSVTTRVDPLSVEELYAHLLAHEQRLEQNQPTVDLTTGSTTHGSANFAAKRGSSRGGRGGRHSFPSSGRGNFTNTSYGRNSRGRGRGRNFPPTSNASRQVCQVCHKPDHDALDCYHRFDNSFQRDSPAHGSPQVYFASQHTPADSAWYPNSGTTHHLTSDLANLNINAESYSGGDQIRMGNGNGLPIEHIGTTNLSSPTTSFLLQNVLHVPLITKNLLSVHKFTLETNTYIEFHPLFFLVKEQGSGRILLQGLNDNGLYKLPSSMSPSSSPLSCRPSSSRSSQFPDIFVISPFRAPCALIGERTSLGSWHSRLGHPALSICSQVVSKFHLPVLPNNAPVSCPACHMSKSKQLSFKLSSTRVNHPLELIYTDVWGPSPLYSTYGNKYYVSFLDAYSRYTWLFPMSNKSDVCDIFLQFQQNVERLFSSKIKIIQSDWGGDRQ